ncbi:MAG: BamA/TamA family outer membrane protein [Prochloraceae cyanobacterium]
MRKLTLILTTSSVSLLWAPTVWGQALLSSAPASPKDSTIVLSPEKFPLLESFSTRAVDLSPLAQSSTDSQQQTANQPREGPQRGQVNLGFGDTEQPFLFGLGTLQSEPTVLKGLTREPVVLPGSDRFDIFPIAGYLRWRINNNQRMLLESGGDPNTFGLDLEYAIQPESVPGIFAANLVNTQSRNPAFEKGERLVSLPNGEKPWVNRIGGGIEYSQSLVPGLEGAFGSSYQVVSVRDGFFSSDIFPEDSEGNQLTVSDDGQDLLWTVNLNMIYQDLNDRRNPSSGTRIRFGIDQSIPLGDAQIAFTRFNLNFAQFIPIKLLGSSEKPDFFTINLQSGTMLGDVPPYDAYNLGGGDSVRGYEKGGVSTGSSFFLASVEYRVPLFSFGAIGENFDVQGNLFFDYATDLGTATEVIGEPAVVRDKPGDGYGYGFGLRLLSSFGFFRFELGWNDLGENRVAVIAGERF